MGGIPGGSPVGSVASPSSGVRAALDEAEVVFWDFDGVVKESVQVKTDGYASVFAPFGEDVVAQVVRHHEANGGMSRYEKLPLYLEWAGLEPTEAAVAECGKRFAESVVDAVVGAAWVPGVREYLTESRRGRCFVLVTATPEGEMIEILSRLGLSPCFAEVHGAPTSKTDALASVLRGSGVRPDRALMVGDSESDLRAARANGVPFLLRRTTLNSSLEACDGLPAFEDLRA